MLCPNCSKENPDDSVYCTFCGQHLFPERANAPVVPPSAPPETQAGAAGPLWSAPGSSPEFPAPSVASTPSAAVAVSLPAAYSYAPPVRPVAAAAAQRYAGFWRRFLAFLIDYILISLFQSVLMQFGVLPAVQVGTIPAPEQSVRILAVAFVVWGAYFILFEASPWQATLGKRALDLIVTNMDGSRPSFAKTAGRNLGRLLSLVILGMGCVMAAFTEKKQAMHDLLAGCLVMRRS
jgi:uncharacterized RDD family membrane protein YckC